MSEETIVNDAGEVMIPTSLRRRHGIEGGDILRWSINDDDDEDDVDIDVELVS